MKFVYSEINEVFHWNQPFIPTLVIENQSLFRRLIKDFYLSINGVKTSAILSKNNKPIEFSKYAEIITDYINFNINQKSLLNKICASLAYNAVSAENYINTQKLLAEIENSLKEWSFEYPCDIIATKISVSNLLKAIGVEINNNYNNDCEDAERIIDYMELVREFDCDKLFIIINMRSYFSDEIIDNFIKTSLSHEYKVLMIDSKSHPLLTKEKRLTIDIDLCEF